MRGTRKTRVVSSGRILRLGWSLWLILLVSLGGALAVAQEAKEPLKVFVTSAVRTPEDKNALTAEVQTAEKALDEMERQFKQQYGKEHSQWPAEKQAEYSAAAEALTYAQTRLMFVKIDDKAVENSVKDVIKTLGGQGIMSRKKKFVAAVESRDQADLVVEIVGRQGAPGFMRAEKSICFNIVAGPGQDPAVLGKIPSEWPRSKFKDHSFRAHSSRPEELFLQLVVQDVERWYDVADWLSEIVNNLAEDYYDLFKPAGTAGLSSGGN